MKKMKKKTSNYNNYAETGINENDEEKEVTATIMHELIK